MDRSVRSHSNNNSPIAHKEGTRSVKEVSNQNFDRTLCECSLVCCIRSITCLSSYCQVLLAALSLCLGQPSQSFSLFPRTICPCLLAIEGIETVLYG